MFNSSFEWLVIAGFVLGGAAIATSLGLLAVTAYWLVLEVLRRVGPANQPPSLAPAIVLPPRAPRRLR